MNRHKGVGKYITAHVQLRLDGRVPVVIYQMGKVGSSSIRDSLLGYDVGPVFHLHWFLPWRKRSAEAVASLPCRREVAAEVAHLQRAFRQLPAKDRAKAVLQERYYNAALYKRVVRARRPAKFISLVRDPVATNMSMFFQRFEQYTGRAYDAQAFSVDEITNVFDERYLLSWPLTWFDKEMRPMLGIDVYAQPFPREEGMTVLRNGPHELLLMKLETPDARKEAAIRAFLDLPGFQLTHSNVAAEKDYAEQYRKFKQSVSFSPEELDYLYQSPFTRHFYTDEEVTAFRSKWLG